MSLDASIRLTLGPLDLEMELTIDEDEVVALLGPNGAGKTTLLRAIAGLVPFRSGHVSLDGEVLEDTVTGRYVPTERRSIGFVFQDYLLFPHLSVLDNVAFGLRSRGAPPSRGSRQSGPVAGPGWPDGLCPGEAVRALGRSAPAGCAGPRPGARPAPAASR